MTNRRPHAYRVVDGPRKSPLRRALEAVAVFLGVLTLCLLLGVTGIPDVSPTLAIATFTAGAVGAALLIGLALTDDSL